MRASVAHQVEWSEDEYLAFEKDSETKHEFLDGEIYAMAGAKPLHNAICHNVNAILHGLRRGDPCCGFTSDQRIHVTRPRKFYTYADGGVACGEWEISEKDGMSLLNPALVFEVLSSSTRKYDRGGKLFLYQQIPSLTDVLLIDQPVQLVEHHRRGPRGWRLTSRHRGRISVLGGGVRIEEIYDVPPGFGR